MSYRSYLKSLVILSSERISKLLIAIAAIHSFINVQCIIIGFRVCFLRPVALPGINHICVMQYQMGLKNKCIITTQNIKVYLLSESVLFTIDCSTI